MRKLKIGDKIVWNQRIGGSIIYTILDIDLTRPPSIITTPNQVYVFDSQILLQWQEYDGRLTQSWNYSLDDFNQEIIKGRISILNSELEPFQYLPKFSFLN